MNTLNTFEQAVDAAYRRYSAALTETSDMMAVGLGALEKSPSPLTNMIPRLKVNYRALQLPFDEEVAKAKHSRWILRNGFRDFVEINLLFLDETNKLLFNLHKAYNHLPAKSGFRPSTANDPERFHRLPLTDKITHLTKAYKMYMDGDGVNTLSDTYAVRNCLVHRMGTVEKEDLKKSDPLQLRFFYLDADIVGPEGRKPIPAKEPTKPDETIQFREIRKVLEWRLGDVISLTAEEVTGVVFTLHKLGIKIGRETARIGRSLNP